MPAAVPFPCPSAHGAAAGWGIFPACVPRVSAQTQGRAERGRRELAAPGLPSGSPSCTPRLPAAIPAGILQLLSRIHQPWLLQPSLAHPRGGCIPLPSAGWWDRQDLGEATGQAQPHIHIPTGSSGHQGLKGRCECTGGHPASLQDCPGLSPGHGSCCTLNTAVPCTGRARVGQRLRGERTAQAPPSSMGGAELA